MIARALVDTNLLVYSYDRSEPVKQELALGILDQLAAAGTGALSTQVLCEFFVTVARKRAAPLPIDAALQEVSRFLQSWLVLDVTAGVVQEAVRGVRQHRLNYWDAQIWAVASIHRIPVLLSEDFSHGAVIEGVRFVNPLRPGFRAVDLIQSL